MKCPLKYRALDCVKLHLDPDPGGKHCIPPGSCLLNKLARKHFLNDCQQFVMANIEKFKYDNKLLLTFPAPLKQRSNYCFLTSWIRICMEDEDPDPGGPP